MKPVVLVTRKLPDAVEDRLRRDYQPGLNPDDRLYSSDELIERAAGADAILPCHTERFTAEIIGRLPPSVRIIANFSVGFDHVDVEAAKSRMGTPFRITWIPCVQTSRKPKRVNATERPTARNPSRDRLP